LTHILLALVDGLTHGVAESTEALKLIAAGNEDCSPYEDCKSTEFR
jgi:hypothetical protein